MNDNQIFGIMAGGAFITTAALFGLKSFRESGHLFGVLGQTASDPLGSLTEYMRQSADWVKRAGIIPGAESVLNNEALRRYDDASVRAQNVRNVLTQFREAKIRTAKRASTLMSIRNNAALETAAQDQKKRRARIEASKVANFAEFTNRNVLDFQSDFWERETRRQMQRKSPLSLLKIATRAHPGNFEKVSQRKFVFAINEQGTSKSIQRRAAATLNERFSHNEVKGALQSKAALKAARRAGADTEWSAKDAMDYADQLRRFPMDFHSNYEDNRAFATSLMGGEHRAARTLGGLAVGLTESELNTTMQEAYAQYYKGNMFGDLPSTQSRSQLVQRASLDPKFYSVVKRAMANRRSQTPQQMSEDITGLPTIGPAQRPFSYVNLLDGLHADIDIDLDKFTIKGIAGPDMSVKELFYHKRSASAKKGLADDLRGTIQNQLASISKHVQRNTSDPVDMSIRKIKVDDKHHAFRMSIKIGDRAQDIDIPLASELGTYKTLDQQRPVTGKQVLLFENDLFQHSEDMSHMRRHRTRPVVRPDEIALMRLSGYFQKMQNDLVGTLDPEDAIGFAQRIVNTTFKEHSMVGDSLGDMLNHGSQVSLQAANVFKEIKDNKRYKAQINRGLADIGKVNTMFATQSRYFSVDTEYTSPAVASNVGIRPGEGASGKVVYEYGGRIMEAGPNGPTAVAGIQYVPDLFKSDDLSPQMRRHTENLKQQIIDFQTTNAGKSLAEAENMIKMMRRGSLRITHQGREFDLMAGDVPKFLQGHLVPKKPGESLDQFYLRAQNALFEYTNTKYSVAQNMVGSELGIFERAYTNNGIQIPSALRSGNAIDTLDIAYVMSGNSIGSRSLGNITANLKGMSEKQYIEVLGQISQAIEQSQGKSVGALKSRILRIPGRTEAEKRFYKDMAANAGDLPRTGSLHSADLDAYLTGKYTLGRMQQVLQDPGMQGQVSMMRRMSGMANRLGGQGEAMEQFGGATYGDNGEEGSMYQFFANQEAAAWGQGSLISPKVLPFHRLQNPVRQLYQRIKPRMLNTPISSRAADPIRSAPRFQSPKGLGSVPTIPVRHPITGEMMFVNSDIFGGSSMITEEGLAMRGGMGGSRRQAINAMGVFLPLDHHMVYGSRMTMSPQLGEALRPALTSGSVNQQINVKRMQENIKDNVQRMASEYSVDVTDPNVRAHLEQIHFLQQLQDPDLGASRSTQELIRRSMENRVKQAKGHNINKDAALTQAYRELRSDSSHSPIIGRRGAIFSPGTMSASEIMHSSFMGPDLDKVIGLDLQVKIASDGKSAKVFMEYLDDPGAIIKALVNASSKVSAAGPYAMKSVGMFGEHFAVEAAFEKTKRAEYAGFVQAHVGRIQRQANLELAALAQTNGRDINFYRERKKILNRTARALAMMSGHDPKTAAGAKLVRHIKKKVIDGYHLDHINLIFTEELSRSMESLTNTRIQSAMKEMGLTVKHALQMADTVGADGSKFISMYNRQLDNLIDGLVEESRKPYVAGNRKNADNITQAINKLKRSKVTNELFEDSLNEGALYDFHIDPDQKTMSLAYQVQSDLFNMQRPATAATNFGNQFEGVTGRVTKAKRMSILSTALMGHSMSFGMAGRTGAAGDLFKAHLATMSGATTYSDKHFQTKLAEELGSRGINNPDLRNVSWDETEQAFVYHPVGGIRIVLSLNPYATLTESVKSRVGVLGMLRGQIKSETVSGMVIGDPSRVIDVVFDGTTDLGRGRWSATDIVSTLGRDARAIQHMLMKQGLTPEQISPEKIRKLKPSRRLHLSDNAHEGGILIPGTNLPATRPGDIPLFSDKYDFVKMRLYGGVSGNDLMKMKQKLRDAGVNEAYINSIVGDEQSIRSALTMATDADSPLERKAMDQLMSYYRADVGNAQSLDIILPTLKPRVTPGSNSLELLMSPAHQRVIDTLDVAETVGESVRGIKALADALPDSPTGQQLAEFRSQVESRFFDGVGREQFGEMQGVYASSMRYMINKAVRDSEQSVGRFLGQRYKIASTQFDFIPFFRQLGDLVTENGDMSGAFEDKVRGMLRSSNYLAESNGAKFNQSVQEASTSLHSYIYGQKYELGFGDDIHKWRGMGVGEGFLATSVVEKSLQQSESMMMGINNTPDINSIGDPTDVRAIAQRELEQMKMELKSPGRSGGFLTINGRAPDFTQMVGYELTRNVAISDAALIAMGKDPNQVHVTSNPISAWQRGEDYDFDINFMATIDNPAISGYLRNEKANVAAEHMATLYHVLRRTNNYQSNGMRGMKREGPVVGFETINDNGVRRVITRVSDGEEIFGDPVGRMFGFEGQALSQVLKGREARTALGLQKQIVGNFGAHAKQGAIRALQIENEFIDIMDGIESLAQTNGTMDADMRNLFGQRTYKTTGGTVTGGLEFMRQTLLDTNRLRNQFGEKGVLDPIHQAFIAQAQIAEAVAIEKYKGEGALDIARDMDEVLKGVLGRSQKYKTFDQASARLLDERTVFGGLHVTDLFIRADELNMSDAELKPILHQRAEEAFRAIHNMNMSVSMVGALGVQTDYLSHSANIDKSSLGMSTKLGMMDPMAHRQIAGISGAVSSASDAAEAIINRTHGSTARFLSVIGHTSEELSGIIDSPTSLRESASRFLGELPIGIKGAGIAGIAAMSIASIVNQPQSRVQHNRYDTPYSSRRGSSQTTRRLMQGMQNQKDNAMYNLRPGVSVGRQYSVPPPPTRNSSY